MNEYVSEMPRELSNEELFKGKEELLAASLELERLDGQLKREVLPEETAELILEVSESLRHRIRNMGMQVDLFVDAREQGSPLIHDMVFIGALLSEWTNLFNEVSRQKERLQKYSQ